MPFDDATRGRLRSFVGEARTLLTVEFTRQLQKDYGLDPETGEVTDLARLRDIDDRRLETARLLREILAHYQAAEMTAGKPGQRLALERIVREQAFTFLNRLAALRMMEARGLLIESVARGYQSKGFQLYQHVAGTALGETGDAYRCFLLSLFDEFALDLGLLFDRYAPLGRLFPHEPALLGLLRLLDADDLEPLWAEDETIGWIYQYFNSKEERKRMRDESSAPRNSRELAVRNQFFTPRYVVEFLVDNTLGRTWYEMRQGRTRLARGCQYLLYRPTEVFLNEGEAAPADAEEAEQGQDGNERLSRTVYVPFRAKKDPRSLRILDPACGSGHFLLYAFDVLLTIYEEAWTDTDLGPKLWADLGVTDQIAKDAADLDRTGPLVDPDSVRIRDDATAHCFRCGWRGRPADAFFILADLYHTPWLAGRPMVYCERCCEEMRSQIAHKIPLPDFDCRTALDRGWFGHETIGSFLELADGFVYRPGGRRIDMFERLQAAGREENLRVLRLALPALIIEHNLYGVEIDPRAAQIATLALWLRAQRAWHDAEVKAADRPAIGRGNVITAVAPPAEVELRRALMATMDPLNAELFEQTLFLLKGLPELGVLLQVEKELPALIRKVFGEHGDLFRDDDEAQWRKAEARLREALTDYARAARSTYQGRLFAEDALQGLRMIDHCREVFDVVVMNPPFGDTSPGTKRYIDNAYPSTKGNLYTVFVERATDLCESGYIGLISPRTFVVYRNFEGFRKEFIISDYCRIFSMADLGWDVLDGAQVETAAFVLERAKQKVSAQSHSFGPFIRLLNIPLDEKGSVLIHCCNGASSGGPMHYATREQLMALPGAPLAYWASSNLIDTFSRSDSFEPHYAVCGRGAAAHVFFFRLSWEVPLATGSNLRWKRLAHGGEYSPFFRENSLVIDWDQDGRKVKEYILKQYPYLNGNYGWAIQDEDKYGLLGLTSGKRNERFNAQIMPAGHIFTNEGQGFIPNKVEDIWFLLGYMNSSFVSYFLTLTSGLQKTWVYIRPIPVIKIGSEQRAEIEQLAKDNYAIKLAWARGGEESAYFVYPWIMSSATQETFESLAESLTRTFARDCLFLNENRQRISHLILDVAGVAETDWGDIEADFDRHPPDVPFSPWRDYEPGEIKADIALRIFSYLAGAAFGRWDVRFANGTIPAPALADPTTCVGLAQPARLDSESEQKTSLESSVPRQDSSYPIDVASHGILVDDFGHPSDLQTRIRDAAQAVWGDHSENIEVEICIALGVSRPRDWLRKPSGFFADHLKRYSKNRRQAPIYWPLSTASGGYTLWLYYPSLTGQTLYTAVNDFVEPKLADVSKAAQALRTRAGRSRGEDKQLEELQDLETELTEFHETLLRLAPNWKPNHDDGVQITAAPLWPLFRHRPWQTLLKETWAKLEKGEYDWAHLAMSYWPQRVREKCKTDKSLAIAHDVEQLYEEPPPPAGARPKRGRRKKT